MSIPKSFSKAIKFNEVFEPSLWSKFKKNFSISEVRTAEQFFNLPKAEREFYGFYKVPCALPSDIFESNPTTLGWEYYWEEIKKQYPIQYFFRHWILSLDNPLIFAWHDLVCWPLRDFKWKAKLFFKPVCPRWRNVLPRHEYSDIASLVVKSNFALILDFYYEEVVNGIIDWQDDQTHKKFYKELVKNVEWIEKTSKEWDDQYSKFLTEASKNPTYNKKGHLDYRSTYGKSNALEKKIKNKETEILNWFVENRDFFWT